MHFNQMAVEVCQALEWWMLTLWTLESGKDDDVVMHMCSLDAADPCDK